MFLLMVAIAVTAVRADNPWITPAGHHNVYAATFYDRFFRFVDGDQGDFEVAHPVTRAGVKVLYRYGVTGGLDVTVDVPAAVSFAVASEGEAAFETTAGFEPVQAQLRQRLLPRQAPLSLSAHGGVRSGFLHLDTTDRLTNLGEGTTDLGAGLAVGHVGMPLGELFTTASLGGTYWRRLARDSSAGGDKIPSDEVSGRLSVLASPSDRFGVGLSADGFWRLGGVDLLSPALQEIDPLLRWAALDAAQLKLGASLVLYQAPDRPALSLDVLRAVWARNNPIDTTVVALGVGFDWGAP